MKTHVLKRFIISALISLASHVHANPQIDSWFTTFSGTSDFSSWAPNITSSVTATGIVATATDAGAARNNSSRFYKVTRTALATAAN